MRPSGNCHGHGTDILDFVYCLFGSADITSDVARSPWCLSRGISNGEERSDHKFCNRDRDTIAASAHRCCAPRSRRSLFSGLWTKVSLAGGRDVRVILCSGGHHTTGVAGHVLLQAELKCQSPGS